MNLLRGQRVRLEDLCGFENPSELLIKVSMTSQYGSTYDIGCFGVDASDKCSDDRYFIFFNQNQSPCNSIKLITKNPQNQSLLHINLGTLPNYIKKLVITATVDAEESMASLASSSVEIIINNKTVGFTALAGKDFSEEKSIILGEVYFKDGWRFAVVGQGFNGGLSALLEYFDIEEEDNSHDTVPEFLQEQDEAPPPNTKTAKGLVPNFIRNIITAPFKYAENRSNLKAFQEMLASCLSDGILTESEINNLIRFCDEKKIDLAQALEKSSQQTNTFLRGMLSNVIADGEVDSQEEAILETTCNFLSPSKSLKEEINTTIARVKQIAQIKTGNVVPIHDYNFIAKNNEIIWYQSQDAKLIRKLSQSTKTHTGKIFVTNERVLFKSRNHPVEIPLKNIIDIEYNAACLYVVCKTKSKTCDFHLPEAEILGAYIEQAVGKFHRKLNIQQGTRKTRIIPQSIKQAVWIRDGGRCVQCEAEEYLEFDHVIPFSKGGANSENNVQLLCRKCNLEKSDKI